MDIQKIRELTLGKYEANKDLIEKRAGLFRRDFSKKPASFGIHKAETNSHHLVF